MSQRHERRVVVTGSGVVSPVGNSTEAFWQSLLQGRSGVRPVTGFDVSDLPVRIAGQVQDFQPDQTMPRTFSRRIDKFAQFAVAASAEALTAAKLDVVDDPDTAARTGVLIGSGYGANDVVHQSLENLRLRGPRAVTPYYAAASGIDSAISSVALKFGLQGPSASIAAACATGTAAIGEAADWIRLGRADVVLAGGTDHAVTRVDLTGTANSGALSTRNDTPEQASRPFDKDRDGFVMAEGAGVVVLEEAEHARRRGAPILAEVLGSGTSTDAYHATAPHPEATGALRAIHEALRDAGVTPADVDHFNAHGTGTLLNDRTEVLALRMVFGERATRIPVTAVKSMTGHMLGAAGAVEFVATVLAIQHGTIPPMINCDQPDEPDLDLVRGAPRPWDTRVAVTTSFGFGGHNAVLVAGRWED
ncbi:beta-ketoacyl-ACP synthase II [Streptomyces pseudoechinosporeus]